MPRGRRRDAILEALLLFRENNEHLTLNLLIAFLYICENEGLSIAELASVAGFTQSTASRCARALGPANSTWSMPPALGLTEGLLKPEDQRIHVIRLTEAGRAVRERLDAIIAQATPIRDADLSC